MTTRTLLWWLALIGGAELALQGHLQNQAPYLHGGAWLAIAALTSSAWRAAGARRLALAAAACLPITLSGLAAVGRPVETPDPLSVFWRRHAAERELLTQVATGEPLELFGARIELDARGFRVQPIPAAASYRLVAVGGSNTFGVPRPEEGPTWPELLEREIAKLGCAVPVSVFNAGRTGRGVPAAVRGFETEIAPLEPDLLLVYPSPADLSGLSEAAPPGIGIVAPVPPRASTLLRGVERWARARPIARSFREAVATPPAELDMASLPLAAIYRRLLVKTRRRGVDVALADASLAVTEESPESLLRRYEAQDPRTRHVILANRLHARLVRQVGAAFRAVLVDPGDGLAGGGDEKFLDLFHLKRAGREQLAKNLLDALRPKLASQPEPGCPSV